MNPISAHNKEIRYYSKSKLFCKSFHIKSNLLLIFFDTSRKTKGIFFEKPTNCPIHVNLLTCIEHDLVFSVSTVHPIWLYAMRFDSAGRFACFWKIGVKSRLFQLLLLQLLIVGRHKRSKIWKRRDAYRFDTSVLTYDGDGHYFGKYLWRWICHDRHDNHDIICFMFESIVTQMISKIN